MGMGWTPEDKEGHGGDKGDTELDNRGRERCDGEKKRYFGLTLDRTRIGAGRGIGRQGGNVQGKEELVLGTGNEQGDMAMTLRGVLGTLDGDKEDMGRNVGDNEGGGDIGETRGVSLLSALSNYGVTLGFVVAPGYQGGDLWEGWWCTFFLQKGSKIGLAAVPQGPISLSPLPLCPICSPSEALGHELSSATTSQLSKHPAVPGRLNMAVTMVFLKHLHHIFLLLS